MKTLLMLIALIPMAAHADDDTVAREAFTHTPVNGSHVFNLKDVSVKYTRTKDGKVAESWTRACKAERAFTITGNFPAVETSFPQINCGDQGPRELVDLALLTHRLSYRAYFIPAGTLAPHQFRLSLDSSAMMGSFFHWTSIESLNALASDGVAFFDLVGEERDPVTDEVRNHYATISLQQGLRAEYTQDSSGIRGGTKVEMEISASLAQ